MAVVGVVDDAPALAGVDQTRQRAQHDIDVGADVEPVEFDVVTGVDDGADGRRGDDLYQAFEEAGCADSAAQNGNG